MTTPQSKILVDSIESYDPPGPVIVSYGASIPAGQTFQVNGNVNITGIVTAGTHNGTQINSNGTLSANALFGNSVGMTALPVIDDGKTIGFTLIA
jgi:hypothetical protein